MTWFKYLGAAFAAAAFFIGGYKYAAALYEADIADMQAQHAMAMKEKTDEYRAKEKTQAQQLADAWDALERARTESVSLRGDVDRVRKLADNYRSRLSEAGTDSCDAIKERLASCTRLLEEGAELSAEGARLSEEIASKKDTLSIVRRTK